MLKILYRIKNFSYPYWQELRNFNFSIFNPLFWLGLFILFLILLRFWRIRKSFSFCLTLALILLGTTKLENILLSLGVDRQGFGLPLLRTGAFFIIGIIFVYYLLVRGDSER
ncbi:MAG TPA: hypothetical protein ENI31_01515 [Candidatus Omnitrophica bacterium]|nr:MAG: hypothetical protein DRP61_00345 [Candidatus Omnitrophota bacterium]RKY34920.1 MAG: hypothetical protein DRP69_03285 [Candidatus Omnitrophota bacterium]RKY44793.1 MAG: hypothetical protein DRP80_01100 [Candidatus Omnitrophota bacterium]HEC68955.1 hypothetical protein [Candidatus Omnitrophota bacterium]